MPIEQGGADNFDVRSFLQTIAGAIVDGKMQCDVLSGGGSSPFTTYVNTVVTLTSAGTAYKLPSSELSGRKAIQIYNKSAYDVFIGGSSVSTTNGILLPPGGVMNLDAESGIYAVCATDAQDINIMEMK